jgi:hypothetical protein
MKLQRSVVAFLFSALASALSLASASNGAFSSEEVAESPHYASCTSKKKMEEGKTVYGVSVYRLARDFDSNPKYPTHYRQFEKDRWYGTDTSRAAAALGSCKNWSARYWCVRGEGRVLIGRSSVRSTVYPWVLVGPSGAIESFHDGAFVWNSLAIEKCMEELVSTIHEKF